MVQNATYYFGVELLPQFWTKKAEILAEKDSSTGDSGGPLLLGAGLSKGEPWVQMGIVSFGPRRCGQDGFPATYTYVPSFINWIADTIRP